CISHTAVLNCKLYDFCGEERDLSEMDAAHLIREFDITELDKVIKEAKLNLAPGPYGFPAQFYRQFWPQLRQGLFKMLQLLHDEELDLRRLNFGAITLIPKIPSPTSIKQFRSVYGLNGSLKYQQSSDKQTVCSGSIHRCLNTNCFYSRQVHT
ncbi:Os12g0211100, partial [Oryza sativa Japonica Group]